MRERTTLTPQQRQERRIKAKEKPKPAKNYYQNRKYATLAYDYGQIDEEHRELVQQAAVEIRGRLRRTVEDMIEIGLQLMTTKAVLPHGKFEDWWRAEFDLGERTIQEMMHMARRFAGKSAIIALLNPTTARLLAAPSIPDDAVEAVLVAAEAKGKALPITEVRRMIEPYKPPKAPRQLTANPRRVAGLIATTPESEPEAIEAEYTIIQPDTDLIQLTLTRSLVEKLRLAAISPRPLKEIMSGGELDRFFIMCQRALEGNLR